MPQQHLDRLSAVDASFLHQEGPSSHMHIGAIVLLEGPPPEFGVFADHIRSRLHLVPRYRQKLVFPSLDTARPLWADDPSFNLEYHVRNSSLPAPGSEEQLLNLAARVYSQQLDRSKPLWEIYVVEGLEGGRWALISKTHHALVDGVSGVDLATVLFDLERDPPPLPPAVRSELRPWQPDSPPSQAEVAAANIRGAVVTGAKVAARALAAARSPGHALERARVALEGVGEVAWAGLNPAPPTPLNVDIGPHRRIAIVRCELAEFKQVKDALGGTVNDVVLSVVAGGLRTWLRSRGVRTEGLELRALVPVSIRGQDDMKSLGNRIAVMRAPLPVYVKDPSARLRFIRRAMDGLKESKQAVGAEVLAGVQNFAPPTVLAQASRLNFSTRLFNLIVTNVPGPQFPLYVTGRRMEDLFPVAFLPRRHALAVAIMSYDGGVNFGLLGDYDTMPDIEEIAESIRASLDELVAAAGRVPRGNGSGPARTRRRKREQVRA